MNVLIAFLFTFGLLLAGSESETFPLFNLVGLLLFILAAYLGGKYGNETGIRRNRGTQISIGRDHRDGFRRFRSRIGFFT